MKTTCTDKFDSTMVAACAVKPYIDRHIRICGVFNVSC